ncbi:MAG: hypothetical protein IH598_13360 [Bacteroidales bacterium]|nr:hypothetical protein [Bacteroidales bacterium]
MNLRNDNRITVFVFITFTLLLFFHFLPSYGQNPKDILMKTSEDTYLLKDIEINTLAKTVTLPCTVNMDSGLIEVVLCRPEGKTHESLLKTNVTPLEFQTALLLLGLDPVNELPADPKDEDPLSPYLTIETPGDSLLIFIELDVNGENSRKPVEFYIRDERTQKPIPSCSWLFRGAVTHRSGHVIIDPEMTMIATYHDPLALMELNNADKFDDELFYVNTSAGLIKGQESKLIIQLITK